MKPPGRPRAAGDGTGPHDVPAGPTRGPEADRGSASLWLLIVGLLLVAAGIFTATVGTGAVARHRARAAADLGALAGARWALWGDEVACAEALRIVSANGGRLASCRVDGVDVVVVAEVVAAAPGLSRTASATARAGPVRVLGDGPAGPPPKPGRPERQPAATEPIHHPATPPRRLAAVRNWP